jgi:hypothetical protein
VRAEALRRSGRELPPPRVDRDRGPSSTRSSPALRAADPPRTTASTCPLAAPQRRVQRLHRRRLPLFTSRRSSPPRPASWPPPAATTTMVPPGRSRSSPCSPPPRTGSPQRRTGRPGPRDGHLRRPPPARDRPRRLRQDHRHAGPRPAWTERRRHRHRARPVRRRAAVLGAQIGATTDTMAKLTWPWTTGDLPDWAQTSARHPGRHRRGRHGRHPLPGHRRRVRHLARGGSVRLIGDDQQLAAIGAGGVLRDIPPPTAPAPERARALRRPRRRRRQPRPARRRPRSARLLPRPRPGPRRRPGHLTDDVFTAWLTRPPPALDAIMLAPTRDLVAELNPAPAHRPTTGPPGPHRRRAARRRQHRVTSATRHHPPPTTAGCA